MMHERSVGATVEWHTPKELFDVLGERFVMDVASPLAGPVPWVPAARFLTARNTRTRWRGFVWCNPPYGPAAVPFVTRMIEHDAGLLLLPSRTETRAYQRALTACSAVTWLRDRLHFVRADGHQGRSSFGSTLFAFGPYGRDVLERCAPKLGVTWVKR